MKLDELYNKLKKYSHISFDLFDTLIFRSVSNPENLFDLIEYFVKNETGYKINRFKKKRIKAEAKARRENHYNEITIDDIYEFLDFSNREEVKEIEKQMEIVTSIPNNIMIPMINQLHMEGIKIIITTDMYLDRKTIQKILTKMNIKYDYLFISGEEKKTKLQGDLFGVVLKRCKIDASQLAHVGDNPITDMEMPKRLGIDAYERVIWKNVLSTDYLKRIRGIKADYLTCITKRNCELSTFPSPEDEIGAGVIGPFAYAFCKWIHDEANNKSADVIAFVAREGYLLKKTYEILYPNQTVSYICLNKNLLRLPMLYCEPTVDLFLESIPYREQYSWNDLWELLFVSEKDKLIAQIGIDSLTLQKSLTRNELKSENFSKIFNAIMCYLKPQMQQQYELLLKYIFQNNFDKKKVVLVNNSINGNAQYHLERLLKNTKLQIDLYGVQFTASNICKQRLGSRCSAWFDCVNVSNIEKIVFRRSAIVMEHLMFESCGTARQFLNSNETEMPTVIFENEKDEKQNYNVVNKIQKSALEFVQMYHRYGVVQDFSDIAVKNFFQFLLEPRVQDAEVVGNLIDCDFNGVFYIVDMDARFQNGIRNVISCVRDYDRVKWPFGLFALLRLKKGWVNLYKRFLILKNFLYALARKCDIYKKSGLIKR